MMDMRLCTADEILPLRHSVLRAGKPFETARFAGDHAPGSRHYGLFENDEPMVCLSLLQNAIEITPSAVAALPFWVPVSEGISGSETPEGGWTDEEGGPVSTDPDQHGAPIRAWQLRGMASHFRAQGRGLGSQLMAYALNDASRIGYASVFWCNARLRAVPFYERNGWKIISGAFEVPDIGTHYRMLTVVG